MRGLTADEAKCEYYEKTLNEKIVGYEAILSKTKYLAGDVRSHESFFCLINTHGASQNLTAADLFHLPYGTIANEVRDALAVAADTFRPLIFERL